MYSAIPSRSWCREVLAIRRAATDLLDKGLALHDPAVVRLSKRLDRLMLATCTYPLQAGTAPAPAVR